MKDKIGELLRTALPFFTSLNLAEQLALCERTRLIKYRKGEVVANGDGREGMIILRRGSVRLFVITESGRELSLSHLKKGEALTLSSMRAIAAFSPEVLAIAECEVECAVIPGQYLSALTERAPLVKSFIFDTALRRMAGFLHRTASLIYSGARERIAEFLESERQRLGSDVIRITHDGIARAVGTAREVVSRTLSEMQDELLLTTARAKITLLAEELF